MVRQRVLGNRCARLDAARAARGNGPPLLRLAAATCAAPVSALKEQQRGDMLRGELAAAFLGIQAQAGFDEGEVGWRNTFEPCLRLVALRLPSAVTGVEKTRQRSRDAPAQSHRIGNRLDLNAETRADFKSRRGHGDSLKSRANVRILAASAAHPRAGTSQPVAMVYLKESYVSSDLHDARDIFSKKKISSHSAGVSLMPGQTTACARLSGRSCGIREHSAPRQGDGAG